MNIIIQSEQYEYHNSDRQNKTSIKRTKNEENTAIIVRPFHKKKKDSE